MHMLFFLSHGTPCPQPSTQHSTQQLQDSLTIAKLCLSLFSNNINDDSINICSRWNPMRQTVSDPPRATEDAASVPDSGTSCMQMACSMSPPRAGNWKCKHYLRRMHVDCILMRIQYRAQMNVEQSPLLRLPQEIRDIIWIYVMGNKEIKTDTRKPSNLLSSDGVGTANPLIDLSLVETCRQIYSETVFLPYQKHTFWVRMEENAACLSVLSGVQAACREHITEVKVSMRRGTSPNQHIATAQGLAILLPNLRQIRLTTSFFVKHDGNRMQQVEFGRLRAAVDVLQTHIPGIEIDVRGYGLAISNGARLALRELSIT